MLKYHIKTVEINNTLTNLVTNPSFETNTTGWTVTAGALTRITTDAVFGSACGSFAAAASGNVAFIDITALASTTYTYSLYVKGESGKTLLITIQEFAGATSVGITNSAILTANGTWQRISVTRAFGATATTARLRLQNTTVGTHTILFDAALLTTGSATESYFDGNTTGVNDTTFAWTGTANNSSSTRTSASFTTVRRNLAPNPNIELNTSTLGGARMTLALETTTKYFGNQSLRATVNSDAGIQYVDASLYTISPSTVYTASVYLFCPLTNSSDRNFRIEMHGHNGTSFLPRFDGNQSFTVPRGQWVRITASGTSQSTAVGVLVRLIPTTTLALNDVMIVDGYLLEQSSAVGEYFDGNTPPLGNTIYSWEGVAGNSASLQQVVETSGSSNTSSITFSNIPQIYDDLMIVASARTDRSGQVDDQLQMRLNGSTSGYSERGLFGNGSTPTSFNNSSQTSIRDIIWTTAANATNNTFGNATVYIPNYRRSSAKSVSSDSVTENNATAASQAIMAGLWSGTDAITSITLSPLNGANITQYSSASLYGIRRGSDGRTEAASGGIVTTSGGYTYHTFNSSGTFIANRNLEVDSLVVAGGGSGGYDRGSGGGAGGYLASSFSLANGSYLVTVGAGGATQNGYSQNNPGNNSSLLSMTSIGGGSGVAGSFGAGRSGGSGSGGGSGPGAPAGGAGTAGQGFSGGSAGASTGGSGGGGGASASGINGGTANGTAGAGGNGLTWLNGITYAGGGGGGAAMDFGSPRAGGAGGSGGGGAGGNTNGASGVAGTANRGGGGGGGANIPQGNGGAGGSGVVVIRYLTPAQPIYDKL